MSPLSADWDAALAGLGRLEVGFRRGRTVVLAVVTTLFAMGAVLVTATGEGAADRALGVFGVAFFGLVAVVPLRRLAAGRPAVVVTPTGVGSPGPEWSVPWEVIHGAFVHRTRGTAVVCLVVDPDWLDRHLADRGVLTRLRAQGFRRMLGAAVLNLPTPLAVDEEEFAAWLGSKAQPVPEAPQG